MTKFIKQPFAGQERAFRLDIGALRELQSTCDAGPSTILARLMAYQPQMTDRKRPQPEHYQYGDQDPDYSADLNLFAMLRQIGGDWRVDDVRETIRLGLIGGGMSPTDAFVFVSGYVDPYPLTDNTGLAASILMHALIGDQDDPVGKPTAETATTQQTGD